MRERLIPLHDAEVYPQSMVVEDDRGFYIQCHPHGCFFPIEDSRKEGGP